MSERLKLRAVDADDLAVIGACLQDALVPVEDMRFLADESRFVMVANRFCWERMKDPSAAAEGEDTPCTFERVHCGISFEHVNRVRTKGFNPAEPGDRARLLEVLTILPEGSALNLMFSGGAAVRLDVEKIDAYMQDMGEPWPTLWRPRHPIDEELERGGGTR